MVGKTDLTCIVGIYDGWRWFSNWRWAVVCLHFIPFTYCVPPGKLFINLVSFHKLSKFHNTTTTLNNSFLILALISVSSSDQAAIDCCAGEEGLSGGSAELQAGWVLPQQHVCQLWWHWVSCEGVGGWLPEADHQHQTHQHHWGHAGQPAASKHFGKSAKYVAFFAFFFVWLPLAPWMRLLRFMFGLSDWESLVHVIGPCTIHVVSWGLAVWLPQFHAAAEPIVCGGVKSSGELVSLQKRRKGAKIFKTWNKNTILVIFLSEYISFVRL